MTCPRQAAAIAIASLSIVASSSTACVPSGSAPPYDAGTKGPSKLGVKQSEDLMTAVFEDNFDRAAKTPAAPKPTPPLEPLLPADPPFMPTATLSGDPTRRMPPLMATSLPARLPVLGARNADGGQLRRDGGTDAAALLAQLGVTPAPPATVAAPVDESGIGPDWKQTALNVWRIENGRLCGKGARNKGIWLNRTLPINARIEFDAIAETADGDLKAELWGDGASSSNSVSYTNATSYLSVLGGWKNTFHVLARINEHASDRKEIKIDRESDDPRAQPVSTSQPYRFKVERTDGHTVRWSVNGTEYLAYDDPEPLAGVGHDHFGFNNWEVKVCFDNVKVTPL